MYVVGTSGHVDHGKSSLVKALTGMDPDRLADEKLRGMTIDLGTAICLAGFSVLFTPRQQKQMDRLLDVHHAPPFAPPAGSESTNTYGLDGELFHALLVRGDLVDVGDDIYFTPDANEEMTARLVAYLEEHKKITLAQTRDLFNSSRRYTLAMLIHLDQKIIRRVGDERVLRKPKYSSVGLLPARSCLESRVVWVYLF